MVTAPLWGPCRVFFHARGRAWRARPAQIPHVVCVRVASCSGSKLARESAAPGALHAQLAPAAAGSAAAAAVDSVDSVGEPMEFPRASGDRDAEQDPGREPSHGQALRGRRQLVVGGRSLGPG